MRADIPVLKPRPHRAVIRSLNPSRRAWPFRGIWGSKLRLRCRGTGQPDPADLGQLTAVSEPSVGSTSASCLVAAVASTPDAVTVNSGSSAHTDSIGRGLHGRPAQIRSRP